MSEKAASAEQQQTEPEPEPVKKPEREFPKPEKIRKKAKKVAPVKPDVPVETAEQGPAPRSTPYGSWKAVEPA
jgi:hypothetical protein